jgi:hypothetical protein
MFWNMARTGQNVSREVRIESHQESPSLPPRLLALEFGIRRV